MSPTLPPWFDRAAVALVAVVSAAVCLWLGMSGPEPSEALALVRARDPRPAKIDVPLPARTDAPALSKADASPPPTADDSPQPKADDSPRPSADESLPAKADGSPPGRAEAPSPARTDDAGAAPPAGGAPPADQGRKPALQFALLLGASDEDARRRGVSQFFVSDANAAIDFGPMPLLRIDQAISVPLVRKREIALESLDTGWVSQWRRTTLEIDDLFQRRTWYVPPPPPPPPPPAPPVIPPPPPPPQAPALPFRYLGKMEESKDRVTYYLTRGDRLVVVAVGEVIDGTYRLESANSRQLTLTYLPLDIKQTLPLGAGL